MAIAIDFPERNDWIGKPENLSNNQCYALPISRIITQIPGVMEKSQSQPVLAHVSCWQLSEEELEEVKRTGKVYVRIIGVTLFPMTVNGILPINVGQGDELSDIILSEEYLKELKSK